MTKKVWLGLLSFIAILFVGTTFANPIAPERYFYCTMFENVEMDNYRVIVQNGSEFYEPTEYSCSQCGQSPSQERNDRWALSFRGPTQQVFLLNKSISVGSITTDNIESNAILIGSITSTFCDEPYNKTKVYKIVYSGGNYTMLDSTDQYKIKQEQQKIKQKVRDSIKDFPLYWSLAVIIETLVLFFIAKIFRKEERISNKRIILRGVIPTTVTLPLLRFVLPLIIGNGAWYVVIGEILVATVEAIMMKYGLGISRKKAIIASLVCNIFSFMVLPNDLKANSYIRTILFGLFWIVLIEGIILFIIGKLSKEGISNKKLVLCGFLIPIVDFLVLMVVSGIFDSDLPIIISIILVKLLVDMLIIKWLRKLLWKKCIIASIFFNLCIGAIILALIYFFD